MQSEVETLSRGRDRDPPVPHPPPPPRTRRAGHRTVLAAWQEGTGPGTPLQRLENKRSGLFFRILPISDLAEGLGELGSLAVCTRFSEDQQLTQVQPGVRTE